MLAQETELKGLGVYTFTYNTSIFSGNYNLSDVADALKEHLRLDDVLKEGKCLIFVCHSMGGIVARKYIVDRQADLISLNVSIGLFLVASPSLGSEYANWITSLAKILNLKNAQADALRFSQHNVWLNDLDRNFQNLKEAKDLTINGKELIEDKAIMLKRIWRKQIVEPFSGAKYFGEPFKVPNSDHSTIAKPDNREAIQHRLLCRFINELTPQNREIIEISYTKIDNEAIDFVDRYLTKKLDDALSSFTSQPRVWAEPILSKSAETDLDAESADKVTLSDLISEPKSRIIKAPPQFGLTCLSHYIIREAWRSKDSNLWLYLDTNDLKPHTNTIEKAVNAELGQLG